MNDIEKTPFHRAVFAWCVQAFGGDDAKNKAMRNHRFVEETTELVQSLGCTKEEVIRVVEYVYNRPAGNPVQEVGGSMVTLAALCAANGIDMEIAGDMELQRCWDRDHPQEARSETGIPS